MLAKKGGDVGDELDYMPEAMRQRLAMQAMQEGKPFPAHLMGRAGGPLGGFGSNMLIGGDPNGNSKTGMLFSPRKEYELIQCSNPSLCLSIT